MKLYGIPNCNTVKKARAWLDEHGVEVEFHDFKKHGLSPELAQRWLKQAGWEKLINRSGMTWRGLPDAAKAATKSNAAALLLMLDKPSVIRRPLLEHDEKLVHLGFDTDSYFRIFDI